MRRIATIFKTRSPVVRNVIADVVNSAANSHRFILFAQLHHSLPTPMPVEEGIFTIPLPLEQAWQAIIGAGSALEWSANVCGTDVVTFAATRKARRWSKLASIICMVHLRITPLDAKRTEVRVFVRHDFTIIARRVLWVTVACVCLLGLYAFIPDLLGEKSAFSSLPLVSTLIAFLLIFTLFFRWLLWLRFLSGSVRLVSELLSHIEERQTISLTIIRGIRLSCDALFSFCGGLFAMALTAAALSGSYAICVSVAALFPASFSLLYLAVRLPPERSLLALVLVATTIVWPLVTFAFPLLTSALAAKLYLQATGVDLSFVLLVNSIAAGLPLVATLAIAEWILNESRRNGLRFVSAHSPPRTLAWTRTRLVSWIVALGLLTVHLVLDACRWFLFVQSATFVVTAGATNIGWSWIETFVSAATLASRGRSAFEPDVIVELASLSLNLAVTAILSPFVATRLYLAWTNINTALAAFSRWRKRSLTIGMEASLQLPREIVTNICNWADVQVPHLERTSEESTIAIEPPYWPLQRPSIVVSPHVLHGLGVRQMTAIFAHEIGHIKEGHIGTVSRLRFLSSWLCMGSYWLLLFRPTAFEAEDAADDFALRYLASLDEKRNLYDLVDALVALEERAIGLQYPGFGFTAGTSLSADEIRSQWALPDNCKSWLARLRANFAWQRFVFLHGGMLDYHHRSFSDRIRRIRALIAEHNPTSAGSENHGGAK